MTKFLKITIKKFENDSRDLRELQIAKNLGAEVIIMSKGNISNIKSLIEGFIVYTYSTKLLRDNRLFLHFNKFISIFRWSYYARKHKPDIISAHNIIPLLIGWLSNFCRIKKAILIYDSHEFELGTFSNTQKSRVYLFFLEKLEKFLIRKCALTIMVNDSIASEVFRIHKLKIKPLVVRNLANYWHIDKSEVNRIRTYYKQLLCIGDDTLMALYHGALNEVKGIENFIKALAITPQTVGILIGQGSDTYIRKLNNLIKDYKIDSKVLLLDAVPYKELYKYVAASDVGIIVPKPISQNHMYALPNKFFENIQALNPIICSNLPEMKKIISEFNIGLLCDPENIKSISNAMIEMRENRNLYSIFKSNLLRAKDELCWERESEILKKIYTTLI